MSKQARAALQTSSAASSRVPQNDRRRVDLVLALHPKEERSSLRERTFGMILRRRVRRRGGLGLLGRRRCEGEDLLLALVLAVVLLVELVAVVLALVEGRARRGRMMGVVVGMIIGRFLCSCSRLELVS